MYIDAIYYPENSEPVNFMAYYPYQAELPDGIIKLDITAQGKQETIDLLYADNAREMSVNTLVDLDFKHQLAKVVFQIETTGELKTAVGLRTTMKGFYDTGDFSLVDLSFSNLQSTATSLTMKTTVTTGTTYSEAIIIPSAEGIKEITIGGKKWTVPLGVVYEAGQKYTHKVSLSESAVTVDANIAVENWIGSSNEEIVVDRNNTANGTFEKPYHVSTAKENVDSQAKWITGIIMEGTPEGGTLSNSFYMAEIGNEKNKAKYIVVDLTGSPVADKLNTEEFPGLIGKQVRIEGNVVKNIYGKHTGVANVTAQKGGSDDIPIIKTFFTESFGTRVDPSKDERPAVDVFEGFDMKTPVVYSSASATKVSLREIPGNASFKDYRFFVWLSKHTGIEKDDKILVIDGIESKDYKNLTLSYDLAGGDATSRIDDLTVKCNGEVIALPDRTVTAKDTFETITISIPTGTTKIEFGQIKPTAGHNRLDNIKIIGELIQ